MSSEGYWEISELFKEAFNASRPFSFKDNPTVVFINTGDVLSGKFLHQNVLDGDGLPGQAKKSLRKNDILLTEIRPANGRFAYVDFDAKNYVVSTKFMVIETLGRVSPRFLYHVLTNQHSLNEFQRIAESRSGTFPQITFDSISHFPIPVPPPEEQDNLVVFLDAIQSRLDLIRETNATLEAIAQAMFKSWFVDFDPIHAKQQGRAPEGMDEATAALFPDNFEESELGLVPKGWKVDSVYKISTVIYGAPFASSKFNADLLGKPLIRIRDLKDEAPGTYTDEIHPKGYLVQPGDIVVGMDGEFRAYLWGGQPAWLNQRVCVFAPKLGVSSAFVRLSITSLLAAVEASETATTVIHLGKNDIDRFRVRIPDAKVLEEFGNRVNPLYEKIVESKLMAATLSSLRDTLLPRLISGQLRLPEAEAVLEEATA